MLFSAIATFLLYFFPSLKPLLLIGSMKLISGVLIEGWKWLDIGAHVEWDSRVTHYSVEFSPDGRFWTVIKDENGLPRVRDISPLLLMVSLKNACPLPSILPLLNLAFCNMKWLRLLLVPCPSRMGC